MVMEFPDNVLNLDGHQNNGAQLKQFIQVIVLKINVLNGVCVCVCACVCMYVCVF